MLKAYYIHNKNHTYSLTLCIQKRNIFCSAVGAGVAPHPLANLLGKFGQIFG